MSAAPKERGFTAHAMLKGIGWYRKHISPNTPPACRFVPTCSDYAQQAIVRFGAMRGAYLAVRRLLRCHPLHWGGYDPVPDVFTLRYHRARLYPCAPEKGRGHHYTNRRVKTLSGRRTAGRKAR